MCCYPLPVSSAGDFFYPPVIFEIPADGLANSALEAFPRLPPQLSFNLPRVDGVAPVMTWTIFHEGDQTTMRHHGILWTQLIQNHADIFYDLQVRLLTPPANVIG